MMKSNLKLSAVLILSLMTFSLSARELHVAKTGSDTNPGTSEQPYLTISKAAYLANAGDTVIVHAGTYREWVSPENSGLNKRMRIVYMAAPGEEVHVKGSEIVEGWKRVSRKSNVWKTVVSNEIFDDFNPFDRNLFGDWLASGKQNHLGEVYLDGKALYEVLEKEKLDSTAFRWFAEPGDQNTVIYANFDDKDPRAALVEVNARQACFFPKSSGVNFITVKGFHFSQACPQWAPPTAEQQGMVGPNWSLGWVIEDCEISNSKCVGISLGKLKASGHNLTTLGKSIVGYHHHGYTREIESIIKAEEQGWSKEMVGSHLVQNNIIHDCGQAGIVGHMGCAFSVIRNNEIYHVAKYPGVNGAETGGIKLHAAIDVIIDHNCITDSYRALWLDWQAQGTQICNNIFADNYKHDVFLEVSHGPTLFYNNILLSQLAMTINAQGLAIFNNLIAGQLRLARSAERYTPYHQPHSTKLKGFFGNTGGDARFYNNVFLGNWENEDRNKCGVCIYDEYPDYADYSNKMLTGMDINAYLNFKFPVATGGNVLYNHGTPYVNEKGYLLDSGKQFKIRIEKKDGAYYLSTDLRTADVVNPNSVTVDTDLLGTTIISDSVFENPDETPFVLTTDMSGQKHDQRINAGPLKEIHDGMIIWKR